MIRNAQEYINYLKRDMEDKGYTPEEQKEKFKKLKNKIFDRVELEDRLRLSSGDSPLDRARRYNEYVENYIPYMRGYIDRVNYQLEMKNKNESFF